MAGGVLAGGAVRAFPGAVPDGVGDPLVALAGHARHDAVTRVLQSHLAIRPGACIVEVGAGRGELAAWFARSSPAGAVVGVDIDASLLRWAADQRTRSRLHHLTVLSGCAHQLPLRTAVADLVLCKHLLCVLTDVDGALGEMCRVARPGGVVVAIEPASPHLFHDPDDARFATLSERLSQAFYRGWRKRGVDQRIGLRVPAHFLAHGLEQVRVEVVSRAHLLADALRTPEDVQEQLEAESYRLPAATIALVLEGGLSHREIEEHHRMTRDRLRHFLDEPGQALRRGYTRLNPALIVTMGTKALTA